MTETTSAPAGGEAIAPASAPAVETTPPLTTGDAARALAERRWQKTRESQAAPPEQVEAAPQEIAPEASAAPETEPGEQTDGIEPAETLPPIEPPRSWTKDEKARFESLPRETQEYIASREQERERAIRQGQNEVAEQRKAVEAERQKIEQARQQYDAALPVLMQQLQEVQAGAFADIKTMSDVQRMSVEDPLRYIQWTAHQQRVSAVAQEYQASQQRHAQERNEQWQRFSQKEDALATEKIPELADPKQRAKIRENALSYLRDIGFTESEIGDAWNGQTVSLRDHRIQMLLMDGVRYRNGQEAVKKPTPKPLPQVQRPGSSPPVRADGQIQNLSKKLESTGSLDDAFALRMARRAAAERRTNSA